MTEPANPTPSCTGRSRAPVVHRARNDAAGDGWGPSRRNAPAPSSFGRLVLRPKATGLLAASRDRGDRERTPARRRDPWAALGQIIFQRLRNRRRTGNRGCPTWSRGRPGKHIFGASNTTCRTLADQHFGLSPLRVIRISARHPWAGNRNGGGFLFFFSGGRGFGHSIPHFGFVDWFN